MSQSNAPAPRKINPPHYFLFALLLMVGAAQLPWGRGLLPAPWPWGGLVPIIAGVAISILAARQFGKAGTNIVPLTQSSALVTDGMFAYTRNPMYLGLVLTLAGAAILLNSVWPWLVLAAFLLVIRLHFVRHEEALMEKTFGEQYVAYKGRVRRWV